jgi:hypothetical protein
MKIVVGCVTFCLALAPVACTAPSTPALVKGETECAPFTLGGTKMRGGLRKPVRLRVLDGDDVIATEMLYGVQSASQPTRLLLPDANEEYTLEYAQCSNERAPQPDDGTGKPPNPATVGFACSDPKVYSSEKHQTRRSDPASMELPFAPPPDPACFAPPGQ